MKAYSRALVMLAVTRLVSWKNKPTRTVARTRSILAPKPAVFSNACSSAGRAFSYLGQLYYSGQDPMFPSFMAAHCFVFIVRYILPSWPSILPRRHACCWFRSTLSCPVNPSFHCHLPESPTKTHLISYPAVIHCLFPQQVRDFTVTFLLFRFFELLVELLDMCGILFRE